MFGRMTIPSKVARSSAESASAHRVIRGGSWSGDARGVRAAYRGHSEPSYRYNGLGFRCAEFRPGVVSGVSQGSEAEGAEHPGASDLARGTGARTSPVVCDFGARTHKTVQTGSRDPFGCCPFAIATPALKRFRFGHSVNSP